MNEGEGKTFSVKILRPSAFSKKKAPRCNICLLGYSKEDYLTLFKSKKLLYFKLRENSSYKKIFCHSCLFAVAQKVAVMKNIEKIFVKVIDGEKSYTFAFSNGKK